MFESFYEKQYKKMTDLIIRITKIDQHLGEKGMKIFRWIGEKGTIKLSNLIVAILTFMLFRTIYQTYGIEYIVLIGVLIMLFQLKKLNQNIEKLVS